MQEQNVTIPHSRVLDIVAKANGFRDYRAYLKLKDDFSRIQSYKKNTLVIDHSGDINTGKRLFSLIMKHFDDYYRKAKPAISGERKLPGFPVPDVTYENGRVIMIWKSGCNGFGSNTGIEFTLALTAASMAHDDCDLYFMMKEVRLISEKVENSDMKVILTNRELLRML